MTKLINRLMAVALCALALYSCDDNTDTLGNSVSPTVDNFTIVADTFWVKTRSIAADSVLVNGAYNYLGRMKDPETNTYITSNYTTQFSIVPDMGYYTWLPPLDSLRSTETVWENGDSVVKAVADSCKLVIYLNAFSGDSLTPMKLQVHELLKPVEDGHNYYSDYDPEEEGLLRADGIHANKNYTPIELTQRDSVRLQMVLNKALPAITIPLNEPYTDVNGVTYDNYGTYILRTYYNKDTSKYWKTAYQFSHHICPGFYIKSSDGLGVMNEVFSTDLDIFYRYSTPSTTELVITKDTIEVNGEMVITADTAKVQKTVNQVFVLSGTEESMQTTNIKYDKSSVKRLLDDKSCTYIKSPAGIFTEVELPIDSIMKGHDGDTLTSAKIVFTCYNKSESEHALSAPQTILMLPKDSLYSFFEKKSLPNNVLSYTSSLNSQQNTYTFSNLTGLVTAMYNEGQKAGRSEDWNKAVLVPVNITYNSASTSASVVSVSNEMKLASVRLTGGEDNTHSPIRISVAFTKLKR